MQVSIEDAYQEACLALGEALVRDRVLTRYVGQLEATLNEATAAPVPDADPAAAPDQAAEAPPAS